MLPEDVNRFLERSRAGVKNEEKPPAKKAKLSKKQMQDQQALFRNFKLLPPEVRHRIWQQFATNDARVVELSLLEPKTTSINNQRPIRLICKTLVPAILHVNYEARFIGLQFYHKLDVATKSDAWITYANFDTDTILITQHDILQRALATEQIRNNLTRLTVTTEMARGNVLDLTTLQRFSKLREVFAVAYEKGDGKVEVYKKALVKEPESALARYIHELEMFKYDTLYPEARQKEDALEGSVNYSLRYKLYHLKNVTSAYMRMERIPRYQLMTAGAKRRRACEERRQKERLKRRQQRQKERTLKKRKVPEDPEWFPAFHDEDPEAWWAKKRN